MLGQESLRHQSDLEHTIKSALRIFNQALQEMTNGNPLAAQKLVAQASQKALNKQTTHHQSKTLAPICVHMLGRFSIEIDGSDKISQRKSSPRPLELLKCIIAFGARQVSQYRVMESLWPEMSGDDAMNVFSSTLCRLRKILGYKDAVKLKSGQLTINPEYIWVDIWHLERQLSRLESNLKTNQKDIDTMRCLFDEIQHAYRGPFLGEGNDYIWSMSYKEKLCQRLMNMYTHMGRYWSQHKMYDKAALCFEQGLQMDPLQESYYRNLMKTYEQQGRIADAAAVYQQCRKQLSSVLGVSPGSETISIFKSLNTH